MKRKRFSRSARKGSYPEVLHPYWRYEYAKIVTQKGDGRDPFKNLGKADKKSKEKHLVVARGAFSCLILNTFPYAPGHLLAVPYRAVADLESLTEEESEELMDFVILGKTLLQKVVRPDGFNIGLNQGIGEVSGGSVPKHLHWHIVPRWRGDNSFMPIIGGTRILVRSQKNVWAALVKEYKKR